MVIFLQLLHHFYSFWRSNLNPNIHSLLFSFWPFPLSTWSMAQFYLAGRSTSVSLIPPPSVHLGLGLNSIPRVQIRNLFTDRTKLAGLDSLFFWKAIFRAWEGRVHCFLIISKEQVKYFQNKNLGIMESLKFGERCSCLSLSSIIYRK